MQRYLQPIKPAGGDDTNVLASLVAPSAAPSAGDGVGEEDPLVAGMFLCRKCGRQFDEADVFPVGSGRKKCHICKRCNAIQSRMSRVFKSGAISQEGWLSMSKEAQEQFVDDWGDLKGSEFAEKMDFTLKMWRQKLSEVAAHEDNDYQPLSILKAKGYTKEELINIEKNEQKLWSNDIKDWTYAPLQVSTRRKESDIIGHTFTALPKKRLNRNDSSSARKKTEEPESHESPPETAEVEEGPPTKVARRVTHKRAR